MKMVNPNIRRIFTGIIITVLFCHLFTMQSYATEIIDTINKYKDMPEKVEEMEKTVDEATKRANDAINRADEAIKQAEAATKRADDATKQADETIKALNEYKESQTSKAPFYIGIIVLIVVLIYVIDGIIRRTRNQGRR